MLCLSDIAMATSERPAGLFLGDMLPWLPRNAPCCASETLCCGCLRAPCLVSLMDTSPWPPQGAPPWLPQSTLPCSPSEAPGHVIPQRHAAMADLEHPDMFPVRDAPPWPPQNGPPCCAWDTSPWLPQSTLPCFPQRHTAMATSEHPAMLFLSDTLPWLPQSAPPCSSVTPHHGCLRVPHVVPQRHTTMSPFSYTPPWLPQCPFMSLFSDDPPWPPHGVPPRPLPATRSCSPLRSNQHCLFIKVSTAFAFSQPSAISPDGRCL